MSADNYYFVSKTEVDGKQVFAVSHRFASTYYSDEVTEPPREAYGMTGNSEGWRLDGDSANAGRVFATIEEADAAATLRPDWIVAPPKNRSVHDTLEEAIIQAHKNVEKDMVVEYGVIVQEGLLT